MADARYEEARAVKQDRNSAFDTSSINNSSVRRGYKKVKRSPILLIIVIFLVLGAVAGFFIGKSSCVFFMNDYKVNGTKSPEADYVYVDLTAHRQQLENSLGVNAGVTTSQVYSTINLEDCGVTAKFLGMDISDSINVQYYYREDISHEMVKVSAIDVKTAGVYYIEYTSTHFAYKNTKLIRTIIVTEVEVDG